MNKMSRNELMEIVDKMKEQISTDELLDNLCQALSTDDLKGNLEYINKMFDLQAFEEEEEEEF